VAFPMIAIFVKTPGLSPVKTRLAAAIGEKRALEFYRLAIEAVREVVSASGLQACWAVAEETADWTGFPVIFQGEGALGTIMSTVRSFAIIPEFCSSVRIRRSSPSTFSRRHPEMNRLPSADVLTAAFISSAEARASPASFGKAFLTALPTPRRPWSQLLAKM
jgi:hypothetical protein